MILSGALAARLLAQGSRGDAFPADWHKYPDPTTELDVYRLTDPAYSSTLPAYYNRALARNGASLLFCCDRGGAPQAFHMDLKSGETRQWTDAQSLDGSSLTYTPDNRSICYFAGRSLYHAAAASPRARELYEVPEGWERSAGMCVGPDGTHAAFAERRADGSRLRLVSLAQGMARTVAEAPFA